MPETYESLHPSFNPTPSTLDVVCKISQIDSEQEKKRQQERQGTLALISFRV